MTEPFASPKLPARGAAAELRHGAAKTAPLVLGVVPFGLAYGILATQAGLTAAETVLMSLVVFAGASQFMAVVMLQAGAGMPLIVVSTLLINLRHLLMGLSLSPYLSTLGPGWHRLLAFGMVDESYVTTITHYAASGKERGSPWFMLGSAGAMYVGWALTSLAGAAAGERLPNPAAWGLDFAMPATFLTMLLPAVRSLRIAAVVAVAGATATAGSVLLPGKWYILLAALAATVTGVVLERAAQTRAA